MKLVHTKYDLTLEVKENVVTVLSVENPKAYSEILGDIWNQANGGEGAFILSEGNKIKALSKEIECIFNPFAVNCNDKKILTKLYQELQKQANDFLQEETVEINGVLIDYLEKLMNGVPYHLTFDLDLDIGSILKGYNVLMEDTDCSLLEKLMEYMRAMSQICHIRSFVCVNLKSFFSKEELKYLYEFAVYEKINIIVIESIQSEALIGEKGWILDKDLCIIELNELTAPVKR